MNTGFTELSLDRLCDSIAESVLEISDAELLIEAQEDGIDLQQEAEKVKDVLRSALRTFKERKEA